MNSLMYGDLAISIQCPQNIFDKLWLCRNSCFTATSDEESTFLYEALASDINFTGLHHINFPKMPKAVLSKWSKFEDWLQGVSPPVSLEDLKLTEEDRLLLTGSTPLEHLGDLTQIKKKLIATMRTLDYEDPSIACVELKGADRSLMILYEDIDAWALGHGNTVDVVDGLDSLTEDLGYFSL